MAEEQNGSGEAEQITAEQYTWLMQGLAIEQPKAIKPVSRRPDII